MYRSGILTASVPGTQEIDDAGKEAALLGMGCKYAEPQIWVM